MNHTSFMKAPLAAFAMLTYLALLAGCETTPSSGPIVSEYNGDSVNIQAPFPTTFTGLEHAPTYPNVEQRAQMPTQAYVEATRICQKGVKKRAEYASERINTTAGFVEFLYLCLR